MAGTDSSSYNLNLVFARPDILICLLSSLSVFDIHPAQMNAFKASCFFDNKSNIIVVTLLTQGLPPSFLSHPVA